MNMPKLKVRIRNGFSDRNGIQKENITMQFNSLDDRARMALLRATTYLENSLDYCLGYDDGRDSNQQVFLRNTMNDVYLLETNRANHYSSDKVFQLIYQTIKEDTYDSVLSLIEYLASKIISLRVDFDFFKTTDFYNLTFQKEYVGYRFINNFITPITNDAEIKEIEDASNTTINRVSDHLEKSLKYISDRENPDYENSIKESISAVEALCSDTLGQGISLGQALEKLDKKGLNIHPNMKEAFHNLFKYTSDATGIRHAGQIGGTASTFEEAKFMLVTCSAFVNYLQSNIEKFNK